jgi:predicted ester cyclase
MSKEQENKAIATRWLEGFWGGSWNPKIVDDLAAENIVLQFSLQAPRSGRHEAKTFLAEIREAFHDLEFHPAADLEVDGEYVFGRLEGGGTHAGPAFLDLLVGFLPPNSGRKVRFAGTITLRIRNSKIVEEMIRVIWVVERPCFEKAAA